MSAVRDRTHRGSTAEVAFEVDRVEWPSPGRLQVVGRWFGVRGRRFIRPTLDVDVDGRQRRMLAVLDHKPWAVEDGQDWVAAFDWEGAPIDLTGSELTVGPNVSVELLAPGEKREPERRIARRPRADVLEDELAAARQKTQQLARELHTARAEHAAELVRTATEHEAELERVRTARQTAGQDAEHRAAELRGELDNTRDRLSRLETALRKARDELAVARADVAGQREGFDRNRALIEAEATNAAAAEMEKLRAERDEARRESVKARAERDTARRESANARGERDAAIRDRDQARQERNVWRSNVRSVGEKRRVVPAPPAERETSHPADAAAGRDGGLAAGHRAGTRLVPAARAGIASARSDRGRRRADRAGARAGADRRLGTLSIRLRPARAPL